MIIPVTMVNTGNVYQIDESASEQNIRNKEPKFFSQPFGKWETYTMYRGCLIVRCTVQFSHGSERKTVVYLFDREHGTLCVSAGHRLTGVRQAQMLIDRILESGRYEYGMSIYKSRAETPSA